MLNYREYETAVFERLMAKHKADPNFTFTVRQSASKGSETDYFIGTEKSKYFATTFWTLPVSFPGSSGDCISLILQLLQNGYSYFFEFNQTQTPHDSQNQSALNLIKALKVPLEKKFKFKRALQEENKMYNIQIASTEKIYGNLDFMLADIDKQLDEIIALTDAEIEREKQNNPDFKANRVALDEFNNLMEKLDKRIEKHSSVFKKNITSQNPSEDIKNEGSIGPIMRHPLNQILFGPPGTGKTYHTINKALSIIEGKEALELERENRSEIKKRYDKYVSQGQIVFTTFHQSMSYEDFVEGIKPVLDINFDEKSEIGYELKDGVFKTLCKSAKTPVEVKSTQKDIFKNAKFYKMSIGGKNRPDIHDYCLQNNVIGLGYGNDKNFEDFKKLKDWYQFRDYFNKKYPELVAESKYHVQAVYIFQKMKIGDIVVITKGNQVIDAIGRITSEYYWDDSTPTEYTQFRKVEWIAKNLNQSPKLFFDKNISQQTIYEFFDADVKKEEFKKFFEFTPEKEKNFVLIIDEINRGNVSQIFGELITLLEEDKREGETEALKVTLPYSKEEFSIPKNLYLIGTMNTADRSVEALDSALRRRFSFTEMLPNPTILSPEKMLFRLWEKYWELEWDDEEWINADNDFCVLFGGTVLTDLTPNEKNLLDDTYIKVPDSAMFRVYSSGIKLNLETLLNKINQRLEKLLSRDHTIGHSFFINVFNQESLYNAFYNKIIPLLQEYFFGDYGKIGLVLGSAFVQDISKKDSYENFFASFEYEDKEMLFEKKVYKIEKFENDVDYSNFLTAVKSI